MAETVIGKKDGRLNSVYARYLSDIQKYPILTTKEQIEIGKKLERCRFDIIDVIYGDKILYKQFNKYCIDEGINHLDRSFFEKWIKGDLSFDQRKKVCRSKNGYTRSFLFFELKFFDLADFFEKYNSNNDIFVRLKVDLKELKSLEEQLIGSDLHAVIYDAKKLVGRLNFNDLIQHGNIGLIEAAANWRYKRGANFDTYAFHWRKQKQLTAINSRDMVKHPLHRREFMNSIYTMYFKLYTKMAGDKESILKEIAKMKKMPLEKIKDAFYGYKSVVYLEDIMLDTDDFTLESILASNCKNPEELLLEKDEVFGARRLVKDHLDERQAKVLIKRYGLMGNKAHTLKEVGEIMNISRERVRQIESSSKKKIRKKIAFSRSKELGRSRKYLV